MDISLKKHSETIFWFDLCPNDESDFISIYLIIDEKNALIETGPACSHSNLVKGIESAGLTLSEIDYIIPDTYTFGPFWRRWAHYGIL